MNRWSVGWLIALLLCIPIWLERSSSPTLLEDTDTVAILAGIDRSHNPWVWFTGDWPLGNHFYRPVSSLAFELDRALHGNDAAGFGATNALICVLGVLALFWLIRELTDRPDIAVLSAAVFSGWVTGSLQEWLGITVWLAGIAFGLGLWRQNRVRDVVSAPAAWLATGFLLTPTSTLADRCVTWLPGRTATVMALFCLMAMASYARYERLSARLERKVSPHDPPPSIKRSSDQVRVAKCPWVWVIASMLFAALALASYEQAVMLPACMLGVAVSMRWQGYRVRWGWQVGFWVLLLAYLVVRSSVIPSGVSGYQSQQFRSGSGLWMDLACYAVPPVSNLSGFLATASGGVSALLVADFWVFWKNLALTAYAAVMVRKDWVLAFTGWALSLLAFLPMAWLKYFGHYHYWPLALRSLLAATILVAAYKATLSAASPRPISAPPRRDPAPGSLHRQ